jgi:O-antigen/teichoic acid export membrane protein
MTRASHQVEDAAPPAGGLRRFVLGGFWALSDQAVVSLGNFLTTLVLIRSLAPDVFGTYTLLFGMLLFLGSLHAAVVVYPISIGAAAGDAGTGASRGAITGAALAMTGVLWLPLGLFLVGTAAVLGRVDLAGWAVVALLAWLVQETLRRVLMADLRHRDALAGDAVSYLGQAAIAWLLARAGMLSLESALAAVAATSAAGALVQAFQVGVRRFPVAALASAARTFWRHGRWLLLLQFVALITIYATPWTLKLFHGSREVAQFQAVAVLLGVANPVTMSMVGLIVPAVAAASRGGNTGAAKTAALRYGAVGATLLAPYYLALVLFPTTVLALFSRNNPEYVGLTTPLRLFVAAYAMFYVAQMSAALLNGLGRSRAAFVAHAAGAAATLLVAIPLAASFGLSGAVWGGLAPAAAHAAASMLLLRRMNRLQPATPGTAPMPAGDVALQTA